MPAAAFVAMASSPTVLGDPRLKTQHFIGGTRWEKVSDDNITGYHQLRVPHQRYRDEACTEVEIKGHAHSANTHWYRRVDGVWKFAGLKPEIRWFEYDFEKMFQEGRQELGEERTEDRGEPKREEGLEMEDHEETRAEKGPDVAIQEIKANELQAGKIGDGEGPRVAAAAF